MKYIFLLLIIPSCLAGLLSCSDKPATGNGPYDSLFLGIYLGMDKKIFYDYCWEMNKKKKFIHGPTNQSVEYRLENELDRPVYMRFYPYFYKDRIYQMPVTFTYEAWAPWNKQLEAKILIEQVVPMLERWYEIKFETTTTPKRGKVYANITGTRRIAVYVKDEQYVQVVITDIPAEKLMISDSKKKEGS